MTAAFEVLEPGLQTTVQDLGRRGVLALGVPQSGALDTPGLRLANRLVGNDEGRAALELRSPGPALRLHAASARIALTGTAAPLVVERDGRIEEWPPWRSVDLVEGDVVRIGPFADAAVAYLAAAGGIDVPEILGSRSTFLRGGFGGIGGRALATGDRVPLAANRAPDGSCLTLLQPPLPNTSVTLRVVLGPQADHFEDGAVAALLRETFTVTRDFDRMGIRLAGPALVPKGPPGIVSDGVAPGALQVPGSGNPILLLADCATTGGYPKIATIITADLPAAGRLVAGVRLRFARVGIAEATDARAEAEYMFRRRSRMIVALQEGARFGC